MTSAEEFDAVRREPNPIRRGQRATELLTTYQQRATELARLRRAAIEQAHRELGMSYTEIAAALGITKGRVTQIRATAPTVERVFFGVGPISIGVPFRYQVTDRERPLIAAEDSQAADEVERLLTSLSFATSRYQVEPETAKVPEGDTLIICGPKSAQVGASLIAADPVMAMVEHDGRWWIEHRETGQRYGSPADESRPTATDVAYVARHRQDDRVIVHVAGIHSIGSLGAIHYMTNHLAELFAQVGNRSCTFVVRAGYEGIMITESELAAGPFVW